MSDLWTRLDAVCRPNQADGPQSEQSTAIQRRDAMLTALLASDILTEVAEDTIDDPGGWEVWLRRQRRTIGTAGVADLRRVVAARRDVLVEAAKESRRRAKSALRLASAAEDRPTAGDALGREGLPMLRVPSGYTLAPAGVFRLVETPEGVLPTRIAHRPILPTGELVDVDGGAVSVLLEWADPRVPTGWASTVVSASACQDFQSLLALGDRGAPVPGAFAREIATWLDHVREANTDSIPRARTSTRMGFVDSAFLWGHSAISADGSAAVSDSPAEWGDGRVRLRAEEGRGQVASAFAARGTLDGWRAAVALATPFPSVMLALYASLAAPLLHVIPDAPNMIVDWSGETSHGKTTTLRVAGSCWGMPDERGAGGGSGVVVSWDATPAGIESLADMTQHMPIMLDDTKRATAAGRSEFVAQMIYQVSQGAGRVRGNVSGGMRQVAHWRCILLTTGEAPATSFTEDAGARARVLVLQGSPFGPGDHREAVDRLRAGVAAHHGHAGPEVVRWLLSHPERWQGIRDSYEAHRIKRSTGDAVAARAAHFLALLTAGAWVAHDLIGLPRPTVDPLAVAADAVRAGVADTDRPAAALRSVYGWAVQHQAEFWGRHVQDRDGTPRQPSRGWAGAWDRGEDWARIAFSRDALARILVHLGHDPTAIAAAWQERAWRQNDGRHLNPWVRADGERDRMVCITREALLAVMPGLDSAPPQLDLVGRPP